MGFLVIRVNEGLAGAAAHGLAPVQPTRQYSYRTASSGVAEVQLSSHRAIGLKTFLRAADPRVLGSAVDGMCSVPCALRRP